MNPEIAASDTPTQLSGNWWFRDSTHPPPQIALLKAQLMILETENQALLLRLQHVTRQLEDSRAELRSAHVMHNALLSHVAPLPTTMASPNAPSVPPFATSVPTLAAWKPEHAASPLMVCLLSCASTTHLIGFTGSACCNAARRHTLVGRIK